MHRPSEGRSCRKRFPLLSFGKDIRFFCIWETEKRPEASLAGLLLLLRERKVHHRREPGVHRPKKVRVHSEDHKKPHCHCGMEHGEQPPVFLFLGDSAKKSLADNKRRYVIQPTVRSRFLKERHRPENTVGRPYTQDIHLASGHRQLRNESDRPRKKFAAFFHRFKRIEGRFDEWKNIPYISNGKNPSPKNKKEYIIKISQQYPAFRNVL